MLIAFHLLIQVVLIGRVLLRPDREPASRLAWIVVILSVPVLGISAYVFLGETRIGRRRLARHLAARSRLPSGASMPRWSIPDALPDRRDRDAELFRVGHSISGFAPVGGNTARLTADAEDTIASLIADIDAARDHVHLLFYIWLPDDSGTRVAEALMRAARRGVTCRVMADDFGSRRIIRHPVWSRMRDAGVTVARGLPIGNMILRAVIGRIDLRNHRKIVVIDSHITYVGSQNCADAAFLPKAKFAPWVDAVMRITGPVARQNQVVFAGDWLAERPQDDLSAALTTAALPPDDGFAAQVIAQGPIDRPSAVPEMFASVIYAARRELIVTTPYYVPVASLQSALRAAANRGVAVTLILPARNDDFAVAAASRSYYADLIGAGVRIYEYNPGLLHAKSITVDGDITLIGSANMDCRSFALNFENNLLLADPGTTAAMRARQMAYLAESTRITARDVAQWSWRRQAWNNAFAIFGPLL
ncbi:cardiolipin synthase [Yoonia vestfoldensis]|uniref:cardiolipin synthase n=1 Tax=Yoonia vestfoldensis TaxID=245188 RepID=UPI00036A9789|nr:cardiolipin synthase [Yoonia vestfoldensis]